MITSVNSFGSGANNQDFVVPPIASLQKFVGASKIVPSLTNDTAAASAAAKNKDACLVFVNAYVPYPMFECLCHSNRCT